MKISFLIEPLKGREPVFSIVPVVDGTPLTALVHEYEAKRLYEPAGEYGGLVPDFFNYGPFDAYFMGRCQKVTSETDHEIYVLGCECGEVGCWPLQCQVQIAGATVIWEHFRQPYRPERDYSDFGPFRFDLWEYQQTISELQTQLQGFQSSR